MIVLLGHTLDISLILVHVSDLWQPLVSIYVTYVINPYSYYVVHQLSEQADNQRYV